ncbi:Acg family FMN-binding oxidoreductase [Phreatobacter cathodiphilus]|uniref:Twin-arginine translocation pathway signal protein n=1 Tax=Phreatobacter cathodiphilus TaxID=1868589 RepID=A0A2S0N7X4_9HYPH|nr:twin-arginine translocation pathway signal protein [Phreatobacter cathodiphilus]AVO44252.1 twin-arginine translocation pathway signal protein [Phreatobacter cathodiphilus]
MNRRLFLLSSGATGLVAATGATAFALTRTPTAALLPWSQAGGSRSDPRRFVVEHAILAPNPHNRQPWIVELTGPTTMTLFCDLDRRLPETDPLDRQIVIGLACFCELAAIAATATGHRLEVVPFPEGEPQPRLDQRPVAHLTLIRDAGVAVDPLFAHVMARRSTKRPYDMARPVPAAAAAALAALSAPGLAVAALTDAGMTAEVRALTWRAWEVEAATPRTHQESVDLMRIGRREIEANPDGISLGGPFLEGLSLLGRLSRVQLADPASAATLQGRDMYRAMLAATPAYVTVTAEDGSRAGAFAAGRAYLRANLTAASLGLSMQPVSQALQEFTEMDGLRAELDRMLGTGSPKRLHMLARLGYGPDVPQTPRWSAASRIRTA